MADGAGPPVRRRRARATPGSRSSAPPCCASSTRPRALREQPDRQRPRPADAGAAATAPTCRAAGSRCGPAGPPCATRSDPDPSPPPTPRCASPTAQAMTTVHPTWDWECPFDQTCQAGAAALGGGAAAQPEPERLPEQRRIRGRSLHPGASATWSVLGAPAGTAAARHPLLECARTPRAAPARSTIDLVVDGHRLTTLMAAPTDSADPWSTLTTTASLDGGHQLRGGALRRRATAATSSSTPCRSVRPAPRLPVRRQTDPLGGWIRGFDTFTYETGPRLRAGHGRAPRARSALEPLHTDGLLDAAGWRLLDDTQSAVWTSAGMGPAPASAAGTSRTATSSSTATTTPAPCAPSPS